MGPSTDSRPCSSSRWRNSLASLDSCVPASRPDAPRSGIPRNHLTLARIHFRTCCPLARSPEWPSPRRHLDGKRNKFLSSATSSFFFFIFFCVCVFSFFLSFLSPTLESLPLSRVSFSYYSFFSFCFSGESIWNIPRSMLCNP